MDSSELPFIIVMSIIVIWTLHKFTGPNPALVLVPLYVTWWSLKVFGDPDEGEN